MRRKIAAGNWKMNTTLEEGKDLASEVITLAKEELSEDVDLIMAAPFTHLSSLMALTEGTAIKISAQNCHEEPSGAFTGEISAGMLSALGLEYVVIAHSERREYFAESNQQIAKKVDAVLSNSMIAALTCLRTPSRFTPRSVSVFCRHRKVSCSIALVLQSILEDGGWSQDALRRRR